MVDKRILRLLGSVAVVAILATACGGETEPPTSSGGERSFTQPPGDAQAYPVFASSEVAVGENRFLVGLLSDEDAPIGSPGTRMHISFYDLGESSTEAVTEKDLDFLWIDKPFRGLYQTEVTFDSAGEWGAEVDVSGEGIDEQVRASFTVTKEPTTPVVGAKAPRSDTPTSADVAKLSAITTDKHPDPSFYEQSIADAIRSGDPFLVAFATPKFCASQTCGPMLDVVKEATAGLGVDVIHVEPYELPADPANLKPVKAALEWGLPSEPWVFLVDGSGRVAAKFEGALGSQELRREVKRL